MCGLLFRSIYFLKLGQKAVFLSQIYCKIEAGLHRMLAKGSFGWWLTSGMSMLCNSFQNQILLSGSEAKMPELSTWRSTSLLEKGTGALLRDISVLSIAADCLTLCKPPSGPSRFLTLRKLRLCWWWRKKGQHKTAFWVLPHCKAGRPGQLASESWELRILSCYLALETFC